MSNFHTQVNVTRNCLIEFLDILDQSKCHDICITYSDFGWHIQYESPFTHEPEKGCDEPEKEEGHPMSVVPSGCIHCACLSKCMAKSVFKYCNGKLYLEKLPTKSEEDND